MMQSEQFMEEQGLVYADCSMAGISRLKKGNSFTYLFNNKKVTDEKTLSRIKALVLPPAWENVWIAPQKNAHLQATGIDKAGRKQYRYHNDWARSRNENKFYRLLEFGKSLPVFRKNLEKDLKRKEYDGRKVLAIAVSLMQKTLIRIGNESYKKLYGSYGLSTLRDKHVQINGSSMKLSFKGKKGVEHEIKLNDRRLARLVKKCRDIPGQELFQYYTVSGERCSVDSGMINRYIKEVACCDFTAKDFRTWSGSLEALRIYADFEFPETESKRKKVTLMMLDTVSSKLGNTRSVCRKYYVFPALIEAYESGVLLPYLKKINRAASATDTNGLYPDERILLNFLKAERRKAIQPGKSSS